MLYAAFTRRHAIVCLLAGVAACSRTTTVAPNSSAEPRPQAIVFEPGKSYRGAHGYIEYMAGDAPIIISAPHGGSLAPSSIPDRTPQACGGGATTTTDANTVDLVRAMRDRYFARFGHYPHVIVAHISRRKLDANRSESEAACGNGEAETALNEWHAYIDAAKRAVIQSFGKGWYMDIHGHGHKIQRLELGYLLSTSEMEASDDDLGKVPPAQSSIATIAKSSSLNLAQLLRGPTSLGTLYANNSFPAVPSAQDPVPNGAPYYAGGENTRRHACGAEASSFGGVAGGPICGVQIEVNYAGVRDNAANRNRFGDATAIVLEQYLSTLWGLRLTPR
ncbi:MAG TPA: hypothetical protein VIP11_25865 [Gemmatimonadaceae bacterium]